MSELGIADIHGGASLDGAAIQAEWRGDELFVIWRRFGQVIAGLVLNQDHVAALADALNTAQSQCGKSLQEYQAAPDLYAALWAILYWDQNNVIPAKLSSAATKAINKSKGQS